jgi:hypothetical protein
MTFWRRCSATWGGAESAGQALARKPHLGGGIADLPTVTADHGVDRGADLFGDPLRRAAVGRRWLVEDGKRPFGRRRRDDVFHVGTIGACPAAATHQNVTFLDRGEVLAELGHSPFQRKRHLSERVNPEGRARRE